MIKGGDFNKELRKESLKSVPLIQEYPILTLERAFYCHYGDTFCRGKKFANQLIRCVNQLEITVHKGINLTNDSFGIRFRYQVESSLQCWPLKSRLLTGMFLGYVVRNAQLDPEANINGVSRNRNTSSLQILNIFGSFPLCVSDFKLLELRKPWLMV